MLNEKEEAFLKYWETVRDKKKKTFYQLLVGLPIGLLFGGVILFNFLSGWYKRADMINNSSSINAVVIIAVLIIAVFYAIFSNKFKYDQYETKYKELLYKKQKNQ